MSNDTKVALLDSAERIVRRTGFDGFSYADLAEAVGIRKASIHHHFPTKATLSVAMMQRYHAGLEQACHQIDQRHSTGSDRLIALIDLYRAALNGGASVCLCVALTAGRESLSGEALAEIRKFRAMMVGWIVSVFEWARSDGTLRGIAEEALEAAAVLSLLEGAQLAARTEESVALFDQATALLRSRVIA